MRLELWRLDSCLRLVSDLHGSGVLGLELLGNVKDEFLLSTDMGRVTTLVVFTIVPLTSSMQVPIPCPFSRTSQWNELENAHRGCCSRQPWQGSSSLHPASVFRPLYICLFPLVTCKTDLGPFCKLYIPHKHQLELQHRPDLRL